MTEVTPTRTRVITAILAGGVVAGIFDLGVACAESGLPPLTIGKAVARGWFGKAAMQGGVDVAVIGIASHFAIMLAFAAAFVLASLKEPMLRRRFYVTGPLYGAIIFDTMRFVVLPLRQGSISSSPAMFFWSVWSSRPGPAACLARRNLRNVVISPR